MRIGVAFYIWVGVFNMVAVAQFWAFANDLYTNERGKRLFPLVGIGASLGALVGAGLTAYFFKGIGPYSLMLIAAFGLLVPVALTIVVHRREGSRPDAKKEEADKPVGGPGGFALVFKQRYLLLIAMLVLVYNLVNTLGGFMLNTLIASGSRAPHRRRDRRRRNRGRRSSARFRAPCRPTSTCCRSCCRRSSSRGIFKYIGVRGALFILPVIAAWDTRPSRSFRCCCIVQWTKIFENSTDYSIQNTTRQALFLPTSREAKYKAKQAIDSFFVRFGDMLQAGVVFVGVQLALSIRGFAIVNMVLVGVWFLIVLGIRREHQKLTGDPRRSTEPHSPRPFRPAPDACRLWCAQATCYDSVTSRYISTSE